MGPHIDALWSPAAQQDLIDIWGYFAKLASPEIADALVMELNATANLIVENPHAWRERTELMRGIHAVPVHPYTIFYRIADHSPEIVPVLHERRDTASILSGGTK
jgi:plasmid stabilization system protein ParE